MCGTELYPSRTLCSCVTSTFSPHLLCKLNPNNRFMVAVVVCIVDARIYCSNNGDCCCPCGEELDVWVGAVGCAIV